MKKVLLFAIGVVLTVVGVKLGLQVLNSAFEPLMTALWSVL